MNKSVNVADFKNNLTHYLASVQKGNQVIVCKRNVPVARFESIEKAPSQSNRTKFGCMKGTVKIKGDLTEPLIPERDWEMHH